MMTKCFMNEIKNNAYILFNLVAAGLILSAPIILWGFLWSTAIPEPETMQQVSVFLISLIFTVFINTIWVLTVGTAICKCYLLPLVKP
jgi:hypothetical protein